MRRTQRPSLKYIAPRWVCLVSQRARAALSWLSRSHLQCDLHVGACNVDPQAAAQSGRAGPPEPASCVSDPAVVADAWQLSRRAAAVGSLASLLAPQATHALTLAEVTPTVAPAAPLTPRYAAARARVAVTNAGERQVLARRPHQLHQLTPVPGPTSLPPRLIDVPCGWPQGGGGH